MKCPNNSGSLYYNYKGFFSLVLMEIYDSHYRFTLVDIGDCGGNNDSGVSSHSDIGKAIEDGSINFPKPEHFGGYNVFSSFYCTCYASFRNNYACASSVEKFYSVKI